MPIMRPAVAVPRDAMAVARASYSARPSVEGSCFTRPFWRRGPGQSSHPNCAANAGRALHPNGSPTHLGVLRWLALTVPPAGARVHVSGEDAWAAYHRGVISDIASFLDWFEGVNRRAV